VTFKRNLLQLSSVRSCIYPDDGWSLIILCFHYVHDHPLYLVCPNFLVAVGETCYGIRMGFIGSTHSFHYLFIYLYSNMYIQQDATLHSLFIWKLLFMFRVVPSPIIRSASNCIYRILYLSHRYCHLPLAEGGSNGVTNTRFVPHVSCGLCLSSMNENGTPWNRPTADSYSKYSRIRFSSSWLLLVVF